MRYIFILVLLFSPMRTLAQDDAILVVAAQIVDRIVSFIKIEGEQLISLLKKKGDKALLRAKKESVDTVGLALKEAEKEKQKYNNERNLGAGKKIYHVYKNASGRRVVGRFHVSAIAPSACMSQKKSINFKDLIINNMRLSKLAKDIKDNSYSVNSPRASSTTRAQTFADINNRASTGNVGLVPLFPDSNVVIEPKHDNLDIAAAKAIKFTYVNPPVDLPKMDDEEIDGVIGSSAGQDWLAYQYMAESLYNIVFGSTTDNYTVYSGSDETTVALEREKSYYYASSHKRTLANQVKYEAGSIMELNNLGNTLLNSKIDEHEALIKERSLLLTMAIKRIRELRKDL